MTKKEIAFAPGRDSNAESVLSTMRKFDFDMAPILDDSNQVVGYALRSELEKEKLGKGSISQFSRPLRFDRIVSSSTQILNQLQLWEKHSYFIVNSSNNFVGVVTYADLNKPPVRLVFFTILCEIETKLRKLLKEKMPNDSWLTLLEDGRRGRIESYYRADKRENLEVDMTVYLMFSDLLSLLKGNRLYERLGYKTKDEYAKIANDLNAFRNNIMHSKPLVTRREKMRPTLKSKLDMVLNFCGRIPIGR